MRLGFIPMNEQCNDMKNKFPFFIHPQHTNSNTTVQNYFPSIQIFQQYFQYHETFEECIVQFHESHVGIDIEHLFVQFYI